MRYLIFLSLSLLLSGCTNNPFQKWFSTSGEDNIVVGNTPTQNRDSDLNKDPKFALPNESIKTHGSAFQALIKPENTWQHIRLGLKLSRIKHPRIQNEIKRYKQHLPTLIALLTRATPYLFHITTEIEKRGLPTELALLPAVESGFRASAYSPDGAVGLWQFMPATGKRYGLTQDWWQDNRRDTIASTTAALDYLEKLNNRFDGDWLKALAAYNAGGGTVNSAVRKNRKKHLSTEYWDLDLPKETDDYIPRLLAISQIINKAYEYKIKLPPIPNKVVFATIKTGGRIDLDIAAKKIGINVADLLDLNSSFNRWSSSPNGPHRLIVPIEYATAKNEKLLTSLSDKERLRWKYHKIKSGDTLGQIAQKYKVTTGSIRAANNLKSTRIRAGKKLVIPLSESTAYVSRRPHKYTPKKHIKYKVRNGDSLYLIALKYKVKVSDLRKWNNLSKRSYIHPGQRITVYPAKS